MERKIRIASDMLSLVMDLSFSLSVFLVISWCARSETSETASLGGVGTYQRILVKLVFQMRISRDCFSAHRMACGAYRPCRVQMMNEDQEKAQRCADRQVEIRLQNSARSTESTDTEAMLPSVSEAGCAAAEEDREM